MPDFVEVKVTATGKTQLVPADWLDSPVLGVGLEKVDSEPAPPPPPEPGPSTSVVQTVIGEADDQPIIPMYRSDFVDPSAPLDTPTEKNSHAEIDAFVVANHLDLGDAADGTKADKVAAINEALNNETPATGDEEN